MEFLKRIISAVVFLPVLIFAIFNNWEYGFIFFIIFFCVAILGSIEICKIYKIKNIKINTWLIVFFIALSWIIEYLSNFISLPIQNINLWFIFLLFITLSIIEIFQKTFTTSLEKIGAGLLIFIYMGILFPYTYKLRSIIPHGSYIFFYILVVTWASDTFAYISGKLLGRTRLNLPISPNKTLEGFLGGFILAFISGIIVKYSFETKLTHPIFKIEYLIPLTVLIIVLAIFGDMIESVFKRSAGVKQVQEIVPGHGGILDVFDSLIITCVTFYFILSFSA